VNHEEALRSGASEKYLLNEMPPPQRDEFEEHYFDCPACAEDLRTIAAFLDGAKRELERTRRGGGAPQATRKPWYEFLWRPAFAGPAFAMLLLVIVYQNAVVLPRVAAGATRPTGPEVLTPLSLVGANGRGGAVPAGTVARGRPLMLSLDIPASENFPTYDCILTAPSGAVVWSVPVTAEQARDTVAIRVPSENLTSGDYRLTVRGHGEPVSADLASYRFTLIRTE